MEEWNGFAYEPVGTAPNLTAAQVWVNELQGDSGPRIGRPDRTPVIGHQQRPVHDLLGRPAGDVEQLPVQQAADEFHVVVTRPRAGAGGGIGRLRRSRCCRSRRRRRASWRRYRRSSPMSRTWIPSPTRTWTWPRCGPGTPSWAWRCLNGSSEP
ncbi:hypothetical protein ACQKM2_13860 [Streptomyces sp. NPDC004126]|uniref:hypothetical protein n=1 Tax=Streptomyces sp. NPDC004126 TaxID=3390695 RepID=UPI003D0239EB